MPSFITQDSPLQKKYDECLEQLDDNGYDKFVPYMAFRVTVKAYEKLHTGDFEDLVFIHNGKVQDADFEACFGFVADPYFKLETETQKRYKMKNCAAKKCDCVTHEVKIEKIVLVEGKKAELFEKVEAFVTERTLAFFDFLQSRPEYERLGVEEKEEDGDEEN